MKIKILLIFLLVSSSLLAVDVTREKRATIILLHGASSVGKSTIANVLREVLDGPYLHIGADNFIAMLPRRYFPGGKDEEYGAKFIIDNDKVKLRCGEVAERLFFSMKGVMVRLAEDGFSLIIDELIMKEEELELYRELFKEFNFISVKIWAPLEVIEVREKMRGDRKIGLARGMYDEVYHVSRDDLFLDTSKLSPKECAESIKVFVDKSCR
jgi:chloramphenicol 3-O phosphotransferase